MENSYHGTGCDAVRWRMQILQTAGNDVLAATGDNH
jgi:hypothetical protein